jgi:predicted nucleic acid-binding Zn ribbon protein
LRSKNTSTVGEAIQSYLGRAGLTRRVEQAGVVNEWAVLVGSQLAKVTEPEFVDQDGTLWVRVKSAAWIQELQLMSPTILKELAKQGKRLKRIRWKAGEVGSGDQVRHRESYWSRSGGKGPSSQEPEGTGPAEQSSGYRKDGSHGRKRG